MAHQLAFSSRFLKEINPSLSLKARMGLAIAGVALVLSILVSLLVGYTMHHQVAANVGQSLSELAYQMADKLDRGMFERYRDIQILTTLDQVQNPNSLATAKRELLEKLQSTYSDYAWIGLTDTQGRVLVSTNRVLEGKDVRARPWFQNAQTGSYVGDVHEALLLAKILPNPTQEPLRLVDVAAPVRDREGNFQGVLGAHLNWGWAREVQKSLLQAAEKHNAVEVLILSRDGIVLLGPPELESQKLNLVSISAAGAGENSYVVETWSNGKSYLTGFAQSRGYRNYPGLGWLILVRQPSNLAFAPAQQLQHEIFIITMTLGILLATLGWLIADAIAQPLLTIASAADRIRRGHPTSVIPVVKGQDEIAILSHSLNQLVNALTQKEQELQATNQQIRELNQNLERRVAERTAQLEVANKELEAFSYSVSHDLRSPLRSIDGFSSILVDKYSDRLNDKGKYYLQRVRAATQRMGELIDDLLKLSSVTRTQIQRSCVNLTAMVEEIVAGLQQTYPERSVHLALAPEVSALVDPRLIRVVMENLLHNAWKYTSYKEYARIEFGTLLQPDGTTAYFIRDNGAGFDMAYVNKLFGAFQRLHTDQEFSGTGIGLATVQRIIHRHGGRVWAEGAVGQGATFYFTV